MFHFIRIIIGIVFFFVLLVSVLKLLKVAHKRRAVTMCVIVSVMLVTVLSFLPIENLFLTFDSPQKAYNYRYAGEAKVHAVVPGECCDLVVGIRKDGVYVTEILPKSDKGWKIGTGTNSKPILLNDEKGISFDAKFYKKTGEYFISVLITDKGKAEVTDSENSEIFFTEINGYVTYYAHVSNFNESYWISVNGNKIYPYK